jgi:2'-5' RNA ligase
MPENETKRLFVAIFPPAEIVASLRETVADLAEGMPQRAIRWTRPEQIHLTLNFLGAIEIERISEITSALRSACNGFWQHKVRVAGLGCFPSQDRPKIIWAGLVGDQQLLANLKTSIDARLAECGCIGEERPFHPHLTIGRAVFLNASGRNKLVAGLAREQEREFGEWQITRVDLMQSILSSQGAAYSVLDSNFLAPTTSAA